MVIRNLPRSTYSEFFRKFVGHILSGRPKHQYNTFRAYYTSRTSCLPRIQPGYDGQGCSWQCSWCPRDLKFETWHLQGLLYLQNVCQEHPVLQEYNLEMVDRGVLDSVPDVLETWNLKHDTLWAYSTSRLCVKNILSSKNPTRRWWTGVFLTVFLMSWRPEIWNMTPTGLSLPTECVSRTSSPPRIQLGDGGYGCSWRWYGTTLPSNIDTSSD